MNAFRRLIKRARNCEHASNVARVPDDRDIGTSFYALRSSRGSERVNGRGRSSPLEIYGVRGGGRGGGKNEKLFNDEQFVP